MLISKFKRLQQTQCLINRATDRQVVHSLLTKDAFLVDNEQATEGNTSILTFLNKDVVILGDGFSDIGE